MTTPIEPAPEDELQFQTAEPAPAQASDPLAEGCAQCKQPITSEYFAIGPHAICPACRAALDPVPTGSRFSRLLKASVFGLIAGLLGAVIWYVVRRVTNYEIGLIAILVGFMVGQAVRIGSGHRGGRAYQAIAVVLTYCGIAANYMPDIAQEMFQKYRNDSAEVSETSINGIPVEGSANAPALRAGPATTRATTKPHSVASATSAPATAPSDSADSGPEEKPGVLKLTGVVLLLTAIVFGISLAAPFLMGAQNIIGLLIIGFALWEAWKLNRKLVLPITGPYRVGGDSPPPAAGSAA